jgi:hypothetical protein
VQQHRVGGDQFLALQAVEHEARGGRGVELAELATDAVQAADSSAVVVLVVAGDEAPTESIEPGGLESDGLGLKWHLDLP